MFRTPLRRWWGRDADLQLSGILHDQLDGSVLALAHRYGKVLSSKVHWQLSPPATSMRVLFLLSNASVTVDGLLPCLAEVLPALAPTLTWHEILQVSVAVHRLSGGPIPPSMQPRVMQALNECCRAGGPAPLESMSLVASVLTHLRFSRKHPSQSTLLESLIVTRVEQLSWIEALGVLLSVEWPATTRTLLARRVCSGIILGGDGAVAGLGTCTILLTQFPLMDCKPSMQAGVLKSVSAAILRLPTQETDFAKWNRLLHVVLKKLSPSERREGGEKLVKSEEVLGQLRGLSAVLERKVMLIAESCDSERCSAELIQAFMLVVRPSSITTVATLLVDCVPGMAVHHCVGVLKLVGTKGGSSRGLQHPALIDALCAKLHLEANRMPRVVFLSALRQLVALNSTEAPLSITLLAEKLITLFTKQGASKWSEWGFVADSCLKLQWGVEGGDGSHSRIINQLRDAAQRFAESPHSALSPAETGSREVALETFIALGLNPVVIPVTVPRPVDDVVRQFHAFHLRQA